MRINASWDYEDLESLLGQGGAEKTIEQTEKTEKTNEEYRTKRLKKLLRIINNDPVKQHLLKIYDKKVTEEYNNKTTVTEKITKINISVSDRKKIEQKLYTRTEQKIIQKSIENVMKAGRKTEEEKQRDIAEDFIMSSGREIHTDNNISGEIIPIEYKLNQNYPNPFNPITNISYQIANEGFVTLKVFDLLGREITTLVNEVKTPGIFEVSFNGSNLSSGIYFYRLEVKSINGVPKNFIETKRMVLVK
ncbi:MAG: T9SS type A sorting domain-containing protein [Ignavibacteria bacterium]|nr:T9SS type A sorting domain-containing protein [Ignavibacteria bacterium]